MMEIVGSVGFLVIEHRIAQLALNNLFGLLISLRHSMKLLQVLLKVELHHILHST